MAVGSEDPTTFNQLAFQAEVAKASGVLPQQVEVNAVEYAVEADYMFDKAVAEDEAKQAVAMACGLQDDDVSMTKTANSHFIALIKGHDAQAAIVIQGLAGNSLAIKKSFAAMGTHLNVALQKDSMAVIVSTSITGNVGDYTVDRPTKEQLAAMSVVLGGPVSISAMVSGTRQVPLGSPPNLPTEKLKANLKACRSKAKVAAAGAAVTAADAAPVAPLALHLHASEATAEVRAEIVQLLRECHQALAVSDAHATAANALKEW